MAETVVETSPRISTTFISFLDKLDLTQSDFLKLDANFVYFGNQKTCIDVWKYRRQVGLSHKTLCLSTNPTELPDNKYRDNIDKILSENGIYGSKDFINTVDLILDWSVAFFLKQVGEINPFNTTHFCWVGSEIRSELNQERLDRVDTSWIQNGIATRGFRMIQTGETDEQSYLDARSFYDKNWGLITTSIMGGKLENINTLYDRLDRQKNYLLKIKKVVLCRDILARLSYFFKEEFDMINTFLGENKDDKNNISYVDIFYQERFNIENILSTGKQLGQNEDHVSATEVLGTLADALIDGNTVLDKDQTYSLFFQLSISSYYVQYELYKKYTTWFKDYLNRNTYTVDDLFKMNLNF